MNDVLADLRRQLWNNAILWPSLFIALFLMAVYKLLKKRVAPAPPEPADVEKVCVPAEMIQFKEGLNLADLRVKRC